MSPRNAVTRFDAAEDAAKQSRPGDAVGDSSPDLNRAF